jgi:hypothetical protein
MRALIILLALSMPAFAQAPARAEIDCGSLEGVGSVLVIVGGRHLRVHIRCQQT